MAVYQKVSISQAISKRNRQRLESNSNQNMDHVQRNEYSSESSDDSMSSSSILQIRNNRIQKHTHHRNYKHIQMNPENVIETQTKLTISRRTNTYSQKLPINSTDNKTSKIGHTNTLSIIPSEHQIHLQSDTNLINARKYTSSSDPSTLPMDLASIKLASTLPSQHTNIHTAQQQPATYNYAYSYASSTPAVRCELDEHKTLDSANNLVINRPSLMNEMRPHNINLSETEMHSFQPSLYSGFVTPNPIEIHNDLMRQAKLSGPVLIYRKWLTEDIDMKMNINYKELGFIPIFALPIQSLAINVDICLETAFICMDIIFVNNLGLQINDALFALPLNDGRMRNVAVRMNNNQNNVDTAYVSEEELENKTVENENLDGIFGQSLDDYISDLFRLPIPVIDGNDTIEIHSKWEQNLHFNEGRYHLIIPLQFYHNVLANNVNLAEIIHINVVLNSFVSSIKFGSNSHNLSILKTENKAQIHLFATPYQHDIEAKDFHFAYYVDSEVINGTVFIENEGNQTENGHFMLCINPITDNKHILHNEIFARDFIFLIDRSGSMSSLYSKVIQGLRNALDTLNKKDKFGIICFNETQLYFHGNAHSLNTINENGNDNNVLPPKCPLFEANKLFISAAKQFIVNYSPLGGTDIISPLKWSLTTLNNIYRERKESCQNMSSIPFIVLITDGSDYQEKEIIKYLVDNNENNIRILTLGIGKFCNLYFLKLLSLQTRGWSDYVMYGCDIKNKIEALVSKSHAPILKDLCFEDGIVDNKYIHLYPSNGNIKDMFLGGENVIIYGQYTNSQLTQILLQTNNTLRISAQTVDGTLKIYEFKVNKINNSKDTDNYFTIPIKQMCIKQEINELTSHFWFDETQKNLKKQIIYLSLTQNISSEYISMVTTNNNKIIGVTNKLFGLTNIDHNLCGIYHSIGQFIDDDINQIHSICCCNNICNKLIHFFNSLSCCCC